MRIGIIGSGIAGRTLALGCVEQGHDVVLGVSGWKPPTAHGREVDARGPRLGTLRQAAKHGEIVFLSAPWSEVPHFIEACEPEQLRGKVLVDVTNPMHLHGTTPKLTLGHTDSGGEQIQRWLPETRVVKALNAVLPPTMIHPCESGEPADTMIAGNDASAKRSVRRLLESFGWCVIDIGGIDMSRYLEPMAIVSIAARERVIEAGRALRLLHP